MAIGVFDSLLYRSRFTTDEMRSLFDEQAILQSWMDVEAALAEVQADLKIIPTEAAADIARAADATKLDLARIELDLRRTGHPMVPFIDEYARLVGVSGEFLHWGATTQDIMDTGQVLRLRKATLHISERVALVTNRLVEKASQHRNTLMVGRTNGQHAVPITLGVKLARWVEELDRHQHRLRDAASRAEMLEFTGAAGTLSSLEGRGPQVQKALAEKLDLKLPITSWHTSRDGLGELLSAAGGIAKTLGRLADEFYTMCRSEIAECVEQLPVDSIGSSTMPQKNNPFHIMEVSSLCTLARTSTAQWFALPASDGERDARELAFESDIIPRVFTFLDAALDRLTLVLSQLKFDEQILKRNLESSAYLVATEKVMMKLAEYIGRNEAHDLIHSILAEARVEGLDEIQELTKDPRILKHFSTAEFEKLFDSSANTGESGAMVDRLIYQRSVEE